MTPDRQLISSLFERLRGFGTLEKDGEAEALINKSVRAHPDATYMLVQTTLIQEQAIEFANNRLQEVEERMRKLDEQRQQTHSGSGSFLGGLFGGRGSTDPAPKGSGPSPWSDNTTQSPPITSAAQGGFMRSAMTTAAGVAGGMLAAGAIRDMLGANAHANPVNTEQARGNHETLGQQDAAEDVQSDARDKDVTDDASADADDDTDAADDATDSQETAT